MTMEIKAEIKSISYKPYLCKQLNTYPFDNLKTAISNNGEFLLEIDTENKFAISWWVSAKRTRSYPYPRVYNTLQYSGKKVTIIPVFKDEGKEGDRDFLQWDTVSLMSLLGINVIISYYIDAVNSTRYRHKITGQQFDIQQIQSELKRLFHYKSDSLHWNLEQTDKIGELGERAINSYQNISERLNVEMHSLDRARNKIQQLSENRDEFMSTSRGLAKKAQHRESLTEQPKERVSGTKAILTIKNYLGG